MIDPDWEWEFIDGSYVKAHQHSAGAMGQEAQAHRGKPSGQQYEDSSGG